MKFRQQVLTVVVSSMCTLTAVSLLPQFNAGAGPKSNVCGDVNDDGAVDIGDPIYLLSYLFASGPAPSACAGGVELTDDQIEALNCITMVDLDDGQGGTARTIRISGVNVQIVNGENSTGTKNGLGNLIVGYNEYRPPDTPADDRTGSHNIVLGNGHNYTSFGGLVAGSHNTVSGNSAAVVAGVWNEAAGNVSCVSGGQNNRALTHGATVSGGQGNTGGGYCSSVTGGQDNLASAEWTSVTGGRQSTASGKFASVSGGWENEASGETSAVSGGRNNQAVSIGAAVSGGATNTAGDAADTHASRYSFVGGGRENLANGFCSSIVGGYETLAELDHQCLGDSYSSPRFVDNGDGTVTDKRTGLMWQKATAPGGTRTWIDAWTYCRDLSLAGHSDWRLPDISELQGLLDMTRGGPPYIDPVFQCESSWYWSSSAYALLADLAWGVGFKYASVGSVGTAYDHYVRAVRSGP